VAPERTILDGATVVTMDGARTEHGKQADIAVWRLDGLAHADIADPVAALVLGAAPPLELLLVGGRPVVERDHVVTVDEHELTRSSVLAHRSLLARASIVTCKEGTAS
jgi:cytosine/adenosine deaminase-related metal-dependent hydrolase